MFVDQRQWVAVIYPLWPLLVFTHIQVLEVWPKEGKKVRDLKRSLHFTITILPASFELIATLNYAYKVGVTHRHVRSITS
ncbi:hypothetical protein BC827DRAFT_1186872 [Russula dissimulans]|nr:hypothetical protein BC827DRAFT_1186872 [Russula dissimulans]